MMNNLFSIFDTSTSLMINSNWISSFSNLMMLPMMYWIFPSKMNLIFNLINKMMLNEMKNTLKNKFNMINSIFFISMFNMILFNNIMGLFPYIFTSSSHIIFSLSISLPFWISLMILSFKNFNMLMAHLIPAGTPNILMPFMVIIESISNMIRPGTLTIRLTANMIAGHLLLTLLSNSAMSPNLYISYTIIFIQIILLILEFSVSMIQSYVFMILSSLYLKESN